MISIEESTNGPLPEASGLRFAILTVQMVPSLH